MDDKQPVPENVPTNSGLKNCPRALLLNVLYVKENFLAHLVLLNPNINTFFVLRLVNTKEEVWD